MKFQNVRIEMKLPIDMDPSDVLARMQEFAVEMADEHEDDEDDENASADKAEIEEAVSVEVVKA